MKSIAMLLFAGAAVLGVAACKAQEKAPPSQAQAGAQQGRPMQDTTGWRQRMQMNHNADSSVEQQVRRLTTDLELTPAQQQKVRELARQHNQRIQQILDTAPPTLTRQDFTTQVHAISEDFHNSVNAILTPRQLALMKAMLGRLDSGMERRRAP